MAGSARRVNKVTKVDRATSASKRAAVRRDQTVQLDQIAQKAPAAGSTPAAVTEQRRAALAAARANVAPPKKESWRKRTATGAVLTGFALGFKEALGQEPEKAAIIMEAPGDPPTDLPVDAEVDQIRAEDNVVRIRPWLLNDEEGTDTGPPEALDSPADDETEGGVALPVADPTLSDPTLSDPAPPSVPERRGSASRRRGRR